MMNFTDRTTTRPKHRAVRRRGALTQREAGKLFTAALARVESDSIRAWARRQRPIWTRMIASGGCCMVGVPVLSHEGEERVSMVAAFIVAQAIGL